MTWSENKSFLATGWKMCTLGLMLFSVSSILFNIGFIRPLTSAMSVVGMLLVLGAIVVWIMKGIEKLSKKT